VNIKLIGPNHQLSEATPIAVLMYGKSCNTKFLAREATSASWEDASKTHQYVQKRNGRSEPYIYQNQQEDAMWVSNILKMYPFVVAISVFKQTKVGACKFLLRVLHDMIVDIENPLGILPEKCFILTGMSNTDWQDDLRKESPSIFRDNIFHHGKLPKRGELKGVTNGIIIIDEVDTGDRVGSKLHKLLKNEGLLNVSNLLARNVRIICISATISQTLRELLSWGEHHRPYIMSIPDNYVGYNYFIDNNILREYYEIKTKKDAVKWIENDIVDYYGKEYRVHFLRSDAKRVHEIYAAVEFINSTYGYAIEVCEASTKNGHLTKKELSCLFNTPGGLTKHVIVIVLGFFRRADLIPNLWKMQIGAVHERLSDKPNAETLVQALTGRMNGYWNPLEGGRKCGPFRTSVEHIKAYMNIYNETVRIVTDSQTAIRTASNLHEMGVLIRKVNHTLFTLYNTADVRYISTKKGKPYMTTVSGIDRITRVQETTQYVYEFNDIDTPKKIIRDSFTGTRRGPATPSRVDGVYKWKINKVLRPVLRRKLICEAYKGRNNNPYTLVCAYDALMEDEVTRDTPYQWCLILRKNVKWNDVDGGAGDSIVPSSVLEAMNVTGTRLVPSLTENIRTVSSTL